MSGKYIAEEKDCEKKLVILNRYRHKREKTMAVQKKKNHYCFNFGDANWNILEMLTNS